MEKEQVKPAAQKIVIDEMRKVEMRMIPIDRIDPNAWNPNELDDTLFDSLVRDIDEDGFLQTITVVPYRTDGGELRYRIVDGEHRYEAMKLQDSMEVPCIVSRGKMARDEDKQRFKTVRMNKIRGKLNQKKLISLVEDLASRHPLDTIAEQFIVDDPAELADLIGKVRSELPNEEMKQALDKAKSDIKTVDDLSSLLNRLFSTYGDTLDYNYMVIEFGGKNHLWVRLATAAEFGKIKKLADMCRAEGISFDRALTHVIGAHFTKEYVLKHKAALGAEDVSE